MLNGVQGSVEDRMVRGTLQCLLGDRAILKTQAAPDGQ